MRHHQHAHPAPRQPPHRLPHLRRRLPVQPARRLVQHQQPGPADEGAREGDALRLAAREARAAGADGGAVALREGEDEVVDAGGGRGGADRGRGGERAGLREAVGDVGGDGGGEEGGLLRDEGDEGAEGRGVQVRDGHVVDG